MAKQLSVNEWKYLFEKYENIDLGNSLKNVFFEWNDENKKCKTHFWRSMKEISE
ncbi:hypothetical protein [Mycoplasmopsis bovis]|uniref:hypothetical protein n=1 Tax=Mycoplasmopsis bovis TaxID=28903 RepID=UPI00031CD2FE|nr:hypothetical protein [Mycoplasmopsis bovis]UTW26139.1 hypothetical protein L8F43_04580 [Mycoplasmopsis bovis]